MWQELAYGDGGFAFSMITNHCMAPALPHLPKGIRDIVLPKFVEDDTYLIAFSSVEPRGSTETLLQYEPGGFDSFAVRKGDEYIINGSKAYCSGALQSKASGIDVRTDRKGKLTESWSTFLIPFGWPGFSIGKLHNHLGFRTLLTSELAMEDVHVPVDFLLGEENKCFAVHKIFMPRLLVFKMNTLLGVSTALYEEAVNFARSRVVCGKPIIQHDTMKVMLAEMRMKIAAARGLVLKVAWDLENHPERVDENMSMAFLFKAFVGDMVPTIVRYADEVHGGMGTNKELLVEKLIRDAITFLHGAGNTHIAMMNGAPTLEGIQ